jgi:hypothetical protein
MSVEALAKDTPRTYKLMLNWVVKGATACTAPSRKKPRKPSALLTFLCLISITRVRMLPSRYAANNGSLVNRSRIIGPPYL